jgi:hypothetical protein
MKRILCCLALVLLSAHFIRAQTASVVNTTWQVDYRRAGDTNWSSGGSITFLRNGTVVEDDDCSGRSGWKVRGNKLSFTRGCGDQITFSVTVTGNQANGSGEITWHSTPIVVRLTKVESAGGGVNGVPLVSNIRNSNLVDGCGCYLKNTSAGNAHSYVFLLSETGSPENNRAYMNIDGRDTALRFVSSTQRPRRVRRGSQFAEVYSSGDVTARVNYVVTKPSTPGSEATTYSATITVTRGNRSQTVRASGECGC